MDAYRTIFISGVVATFAMSAGIGYFSEHKTRSGDLQLAQGLSASKMAPAAQYFADTAGPQMTVCLDGRAYVIVSAGDGGKRIALAPERLEQCERPQ